MQLRKIVALISLISFTQAAFAQKDFKGWHLRDAGRDSFYGISLQQTYDFVKNRTARPVVVAVIDSGIDTTHEDLKKVLWRNTKEIAGNGKDDDNNGYVDDIYGWNFIGGRDGRNIDKESMEASRVFHKYKDKFYRKEIDESLLSKDEKQQYTLWKTAAKILEVDRDEHISIMFLEVAYKAAKKHEKVLKTEMNQESFKAEDVEKFQPQTQPGKQAKMAYLTFLKLTEMESDATNTTIFSELEEYLKDKKLAIEAKEVAPVNYREEIVQDDYYNLSDRHYGNNDVMGPSPMHGTHVSGIIAADRSNGNAMEGIAENVKIMTIRAVPDGDEYDKDVALAIKYAVDNGAKVINMSFGKGLSPEKKWVDEAVKYAEMKDVLLVHAAGNDGKNNDSVASFPNRYLNTLNSTASNFIAVGASSDTSVSGSIVAEFSNYGKESVDVFAPGVKIYSTLPGGNKYGFMRGTSMAAPVVSGVAAIIRSYFPHLSAKQVKYVLQNSVDKLDTVVVTKPGSKEKIFFGELSSSGGKINAYKAVALAATLKPEVKEEKRITEKKAVKPDASTFKNKPVTN